jgi:hypothetical protein
MFHTLQVNICHLPITMTEYTKYFVCPQMLYCSVGIWTGLSFNKVGEGLCPRGGGSSAGMLVQTSALGSDGDLFVGGALLFLVVCIYLPLIVMGWSGEALIVMYLLHVVSVCALRVIHSFDLF